MDPQENKEVFEEIDFGEGMLEESAEQAPVEISTPEKPTMEAEDGRPPSEETPPARDYEAEAIKIGWIPPDKFKGDPSKAKDAKTFIEDGENFIPFIKANNRKLEEEREKLTSELEDLKTGLVEVKKFHKENLERVKQAAEEKYNRDLSRLKADMRQAAEDEDYEEMDRLGEERDKLTQEHAKPEHAKPEPAEPEPAEAKPPEGRQEPDKAKVNEAIDGFIKDNPWYSKDPELKKEAVAMEAYVARKNPELSPEDPAYYGEIAKEVKLRFPAKFENPRRNEGGTVEGSTGTTTRSTKPQFADLPADKQTECRNMEKAGTYTQEEYMTDYFAFEANGYVEFD